jgi:hypothetical protein
VTISSRAFGIAVTVASVASAVPAASQGPPPTTAGQPPKAAIEQVVVTGKKLRTPQDSDAASDGVVQKVQLTQRPVYRVGELLETVPGLIVTQHSGEGKANQYFLRGFNLDHGTDIEITVDDMPVNMRTHAHGQGYSDINFVIPELIGGLSYRKGTYSAPEGDFATAGAVHVTYVDDLEKDLASVSAGTLGDQRVFAAGSRPVGRGVLLAAGEFVHLDGPFKIPDNFLKENVFARYSQGDADQQFSLTGMYLHDTFHATNQIPQRAVEAGLIDRFGTIDPTDRGATQRFSVSGKYATQLDGGKLVANAYLIGYQFQLLNDFTYFLDFAPPVGDQFEQQDNRLIYGGSVNYTKAGSLFGFPSENTIGTQVRYDAIDLKLSRTTRTLQRFSVRHDVVDEFSTGLYGENRTRWADKFRTVLGLRGDAYYGHDSSDLAANSGSTTAFIPSPKGSAIFGPWADTELYLSAGRGFHSNDVRGALTSVSALGTLLNRQQGNSTIVTSRPTPFLTAATGYEIGLRSKIVPHLRAELALFQLDLDSELTFSGDAGDTSAGRPSQRRGVEVSTFYTPVPWLTVAVDFAYSHARFTDPDAGRADAIAGRLGNFIPGSPEIVASVGVTVENLGRWQGGLEYRYFGPRALTEDNFYHSNSTQLVNARVGYRITDDVVLQVDVFNIFDSHAHQIDYAYASLLPSDNPARINPLEGGVDDIHFHPVEPRSTRFTLNTRF